MRREKAPIDVILLDLLMPELDGRMFLDELAKRPGKRPPVVVTSELLGLIDTPSVTACLKKPVAKDPAFRPTAAELSTSQRAGASPRHGRRLSAASCSGALPMFADGRAGRDRSPMQEMSCAESPCPSR